MVEDKRSFYKYLRASKKFPSVWCPGCGMGIFTRALIGAIEKSGYSQDEIVIVSGIGCSGRLTAYIDFNTLHTTHGRALTFATGLMLANPKLKVITIMGDGDALAIGGNHFIHAARRNMDITAIVINNSIYGMTGGQVSPGTPLGMNTVTSPYGNVEKPFDICEMAQAAGSNFVARSTIYNVGLMDKLIGTAIKKKGFSMLEIISQCPIHYGRRAGYKSAVEMLEWQRDNAVTSEKAKGMSQDELKGKIRIGVLVDRQDTTYLERLQVVRDSIKEKSRAL
jgi:2-oxoglutarate ferredoxin oxidoreductase subunit beta